MIYKKISGFSDEIHENTKRQFEVLNNLGVSYFEPRGIDGKNISTLSEEEMHALKSMMDEYGIQASSIGSPVGKIKVTDDFEVHFQMYKNVVKAAKILGARYIRIFSFYHEMDTEWTEEERAEVYRRLEKLIEYAKEEDVVLLHENEKHIYGDTVDRGVELMQKFYGPNFKAVFDPANYVQTGEDTKRAYEMMKPYIAYMHIKDALYENEYVVPAGCGDGNVEYILTQLFASGYDGFLSLEPHLGDFKGFEDLEVVEQKQVKTLSGVESFTLAHQSLMIILNNIREEQR